MMNKSDISIGAVKFGKDKVRVIYDQYNSVKWLCLYDILKILGRIELIENGRAMRICRSAFRIPFKEGGRNRWGVKPFDLHSLLKTISSENGMIAKVCKNMEKWVNALPVQMDSNIKIKQSAPTQQAVIFNYQDKFPITFKADNGRTYVNATQMSRSFDKYPYVWLGLAHVKEFRQMLVDTGKSGSLESQVFTARGANGATWIEESLAMEFARWLSPDFSDWCNSRIEELVTTGYVALQPTQSQRTPVKTQYRKTLGEAVGNFPVPQNFDEALLLAAEQARKIREDEHKVAFYDEFVENRDYYRSIRIADELELSIVALNRFLAEEGIIFFENKQWVVHAPYRPLQCEVPYMWEKRPGKVYPTGSVKRWTKAGREYIIELWYSRHPELMSKPERG